MKYFPFKIMVLCILLPPILYMLTNHFFQQYLESDIFESIENTYIGDTQPLFSGAVELKDAIQNNIDTFVEGNVFIGLGVQAIITVTTKDGRLLYPASFAEQEEGDFLMRQNQIQTARDNYTLLNEGVRLNVDVMVGHNSVVAIITLSVFILGSFFVLLGAYRSSLRRFRIEEGEQRQELDRLLDVESENRNRLKRLKEGRGKLLKALDRMKANYEEEKGRADRNEDQMIEEIVALEKNLQETQSLLAENQSEIEAMKETVEQFKGDKAKTDRKKPKLLANVRKRFKALYKNIAFTDRAIDGFIRLNEDMKIKAEEVIHQLNDAPGNVIVKRKVFGKKNRETAFENIFAYKGRLYFRNVGDNSIEILAIGTKQTQSKDLTFLDKL